MRTLTPQDRDFVRAVVADAVIALIQADQALAERVAALENFAASFAPGNEYEDTRKALVESGLVIEQKFTGPTRPKRRGLFRRKSTK